MNPQQLGASAAAAGRCSDRDIATSLPVAAKVRLLTGADNWRTRVILGPACAPW